MNELTERRLMLNEEADDFARLRIEERDGKPAMISGYAAVFNRRSLDLGGFTEEIAPGAFAEVLASGDVRALFNHDPNMILGRKSAGTLRVFEDERGLRYEIDPPQSGAGPGVMESIRRGDVSGSSFSFSKREDKWDHSGGKHHRTVLSVASLGDVGPVTYPAYPDTSVAMRSIDSFLKSADPRPSDQLYVMRQRQASALR